MRDDSANIPEKAPLRLIAIVMAVGWTVFSYAYLYQRFFLSETATRSVPVALLLGLSPVVLAVALIAAARTRGSWADGLNRVLDLHTDAIDAWPKSQLPVRIALAAGVGLFLELGLIRIHSSYFQLFAYFKNVSLLSCFLGLGIGYAIGKGKRLSTPLVLPLLAVQVVLLYVLRFVGVGDLLQNPIAEQLTLGMDQSTDLVHVLTVYGFLVFFFCLNTLCFIPLGQVASRLMTRMDALPSYSWNLIGSLLGIALFTGVSMAWTPPAVWLAIGAAGVLLLLPGGRGVALPTGVAATAMLGVLVLVTVPNQRDIYSPYQILSIRNVDGYPEVNVNNVYFQKVLDLSDEGVAADPRSDMWVGHYRLPYLFQPDPSSVLVVGAGTGNDVAAALRAGAESVDAVEIDPAIQQLGEILHPEAPYDSPAVNVIINDARAFVRHTDKEYDLIVYGLLDSHTLLSGRGGVRLDSYVYTLEAFREAAARLTDDGVPVLTFAIIRPRLGRKLYLMLEEAFAGEAPLVYQTVHDGGIAFVTGPGVHGGSAEPDPQLLNLTEFFAESMLPVDLSTDDWPFFYMPQRTYPTTYLVMIGVLLVLSLTFVRSFLESDGRSTVGFSAPCFFLGAGFMLIETKGITELALVYGSTWVVISVVVAAILTMAFLANTLIIKIGSPPRAVSYGLLTASLLVGVAAYTFGLPSLSPNLERIVLTGVLTLPLFFLGFAFSTELDRSSSVPIALSSNLMGAMVGGFLEYNSMYFGFGSLYWLALAMYGLAWLTSVRPAAFRMRVRASDRVGSTA